VAEVAKVAEMAEVTEVAEMAEVAEVAEGDFKESQTLHHHLEPKIKKVRSQLRIGTITLVLPNKHQNIKQ
jgi:hypothetical protein